VKGLPDLLRQRIGRRRLTLAVIPNLSTLLQEKIAGFFELAFLIIGLYGNALENTLQQTWNYCKPAEIDCM